MRTITSRQHSIVKEFRRVAHGDTKLALLDGWHLVAEAIRSGVPIDTIAFVSAGLDSGMRTLLDRAAAQPATLVEVSTAVMAAMSPVRTPTGIAALVARRTAPLPALLAPAPALVVLAVDMQDPGNVGAVIRSAEAGGATGVALAGASSDPWTWKALRASMGSTLRLPTRRVADAAATMDALRQAGLALLAGVPRGGTVLHDADLRRPVAVLIGGEGAGLSDALTASADMRVTIPMKPPVESLNAAVALALIVYEARRQREGTP